MQDLRCRLYPGRYLLNRQSMANDPSARGQDLTWRKMQSLRRLPHHFRGILITLVTVARIGVSRVADDGSGSPTFDHILIAVDTGRFHDIGREDTGCSRIDIRHDQRQVFSLSFYAAVHASGLKPERRNHAASDNFHITNLLITDLLGPHRRHGQPRGFREAVHQV